MGRTHSLDNVPFFKLNQNRNKILERIAEAKEYGNAHCSGPDAYANPPGFKRGQIVGRLTTPTPGQPPADQHPTKNVAELVADLLDRTFLEQFRDMTPDLPQCQRNNVRDVETALQASVQSIGCVIVRCDAMHTIPGTDINKAGEDWLKLGLSDTDKTSRNNLYEAVADVGKATHRLVGEAKKPPPPRKIGEPIKYLNWTNFNPESIEKKLEKSPGEPILKHGKKEDGKPKRNIAFNTDEND